MTTVSTLVDALLARPFPAQVAVVQDEFNVVISRGSKDNVKVGQRFVIYGMGPEVVDPETRESLGLLEVVRGTGVVVHLQDKIATLRSDRKHQPTKRVVKSNPLLGWQMGQEETIYEQSEPRPFDAPSVGDLAKPV